MFDQPPAYHVVVPSKTQIQAKAIEVENCLRNCYHIDQKSAYIIMDKLSPLLETIDGQQVLDDFIAKSKALNIQFSAMKTENNLPEDDAFLQAPQWHEILFESPYVRVLWGDSTPGDKEPYHKHHWKSLMLIIQGARFEIEEDDGTIVNDMWPMGVYELPADSKPAAYTNQALLNSRPFDLKSKIDLFARTIKTFYLIRLLFYEKGRKVSSLRLIEFSKQCIYNFLK